MAEKTVDEATVDALQEQSQTITTLLDHIVAGNAANNRDVSYVQPVRETPQTTPNYALYAVIGLGALLIFRKGK